MSEAPPTEDLDDLYENAPCGYVSISPRGSIVKINKTLLDWLGRCDADLLGTPLHDILSFGGKIAFETHLAPLLRLQGFVYEIALDIVDAEGNKIPVIANATKKRGREGEHQFTRLTMFKAVDRRTFERSLIEARIKAQAQASTEQEANALRDQFIAVLGHDLRNPLAAILAGVGMLKRDDSLAGPNIRIVEEMEGAAARANTLIDNVLDFARGKLGRGISLKRDPGRPLGPIFDQVVSEVRTIWPDREFETHFDLAHRVDCDPDRIGQLAANLLANAATHGAPGTPIRVNAVTTEDSLEFSVSNAGHPIPGEVRGRLFEPFFRGGETPSANGLGLGLYIVNEIATAHDGTMQLSSDAEQTRFTLTMPRQIGSCDAGGQGD